MKNVISLKKSLLSLSLMTATLFTSQAALAEVTPKSVIADSRIKQVPYQKNNVVPIEGQAFVNTQILFGEDEVILDVQGGDEAGWTYHIDKSLPFILNIKPTLFNSNTNLDVVTNDAENTKRIYRFHLLMGSEINQTKSAATYAVEFIYPDKNKAKLQETLNYLQQQKKSILSSSKSPADYNWDYSFNGSKTILPMHVFDDGRFTYLQLRPGQPVPSVFAVDNAAGEEAVVNVRTEGDYLVVQQISPQLTLRQGEHHVASIFNNSNIAKLRVNGEG
jgi:type IV secretion system protein VirB9